MKAIKKALAATALPALALVGNTPASAVTLATVTIDENGNGFGQSGEETTILQYVLRDDPGPGGLPNVLTYLLPAGVNFVAGDVFLQDLFNGELLTLDVIRFNSVTRNSPSTIVFYSDDLDGAEALGDTIGPPAAFYANTVTLREIDLEGIGDGADYTPTANQPGFISGASVTYRFISDGVAGAPEPATWAMMIVGFSLIGRAMRKSRQRQTVRYSFA